MKHVRSLDYRTANRVLTLLGSGGVGWLRIAWGGVVWRRDLHSTVELRSKGPGRKGIPPLREII